MSTPYVVTTLIDKYARLLGEREFAERDAETAHGRDALLAAWADIKRKQTVIDNHLFALRVVIWLFEPTWDEGSVRPLTPRKKYGAPGEISRAALAVLKNADRPMKTREIARAVLSRLGHAAPEEREIVRVEGAIYGSLDKHTGSTIVRSIERPTRWSLVPRDQVKVKRKGRVPVPKLLAAE